MNNDPEIVSDGILELLDLYVVGALDEKESVQAKNILSVSAYAKSYVYEQRALLSNLETDAPSDPRLFVSIKSAISKNAVVNEDAAKVADITRAASLRKTTRTKISYLAIAASIFAVVISISIVFTGTSNTSNTASKNMDMKKDMEMFASQKTTQKMALANANGDAKVELMMDDKGNVMVDGRSLETLSKTETYQLWAIVADSTPGSNGSKVISAGVFGNDPDITMTHVDGDIKGFALTREVSGGVVKSNNEALYSHMLA